LQRILQFAQDVEQDLLGKMEGSKPRVKRLTAIERTGLACFLVAFLASIGMIGYAQVTTTDSLFWQFLLTSLISMMAGFLYGVNRSK